MAELRSRRAAWLLWPLIAALHLALLLTLQLHAPKEQTKPRVFAELRLLPLAAPTPQLAGMQPGPRHEARRNPPRAAAVAAPEATHEAAEPETPMPAQVSVASSPRPALLDADATRNAIRLAARQSPMSARAAAASQDPGRETTQQRLGREVAQSAYGNCLKGEFPGGGGGLLSLPFWLVAEARGKCQK